MPPALVNPTEPTAASQAAAPASPTVHRYDTRIGPVPIDPPHPRPVRRPPPPKRAKTSGPGESSQSQPQVLPQSPPPQGASASTPLSPGSILSAVMRPLFLYAPIEGNTDCSNKDFHNEHFYDISTFANLPELRDSMGLVQRYSLESFMTPHRFFYLRVVIDFYQTMTSRGEHHPTAIHFTIDGGQGILRAADRAIAFHLPVALANSADYRQWPHPSPREMVWILSLDTSASPILFRRHLPTGMLFVDHVLRSNLLRGPISHL